MLHFKCEGCRLRLARKPAPANLVDDRCPGCGAMLEPVRRLSEIVGFRAIDESALLAHDDAGDGHRWLAARVLEVRGGRQSPLGSSRAAAFASARDNLAEAPSEERSSSLRRDMFGLLPP
jgi:hypothetical protein